MSNLVYLDYLSTTPADPRVAEAMSACLTLDGTFGNPASRSHRFGWEAEMAVEEARRHVADLIGADLREIVWTSGATESDNLAIKGVVAAANAAAHDASWDDAALPHIVTSTTEHKAVLDAVGALEEEGAALATYVSPGRDGRIDPAAVAAAIAPNTCLVSIMHANNEIGTVNDIASIAAIAHAADVPLHVDAAQSVGKIPVDVAALGIDLLSMSAHKFYGPKGMGALYVRRHPRPALRAQVHGGGHERGYRSGTLATHQIVGMGTAAKIAAEELAEEGKRLTEMREALWADLSRLDGITLNGHPTERLPGALNVSVAGVEGEALLLSLSEFALSTGSACTSASMEPSYVLRALGVPDALAHSSLRISLGRFTRDDELERFVDRFSEVVPRLRRESAA